MSWNQLRFVLQVVSAPGVVDPSDVLASQPLDITADGESYELPTAEAPPGASGSIGGRSGASYYSSAVGAPGSMPKLESFRTAIEPDGEGNSVGNVADFDTTT